MPAFVPEEWIPTRIFPSPTGLMVDWSNIGSGRFTDPFFEQTVGRARTHLAHAGSLSRRRTSIEELEALSARQPGLKPTAFIFHLSRCGSTLVSRMLAAVARNIVISEAPPLDHVLHAHLLDARVTPAQQVRWLRSAVHSLGHPRTGEDGYFIKWDSWHILKLPLIREAYPAVPWIFLYRDPLEVMVSHIRMRGMQMIPGAMDARVFGPDWPAAPPLPLDEYGARVLARLCDGALENLPLGGGTLVNYQELPEAVFGRLAPIFGRNYSVTEKENMVQATRTNAKEPSLPYVDDIEAKQREATVESRELVKIWLAERYDRLEAARLSQSA